MFVVLLLLLAVAGGTFATGTYILAGHGNTAPGRWLAKHLPLRVIRAMRWASDWFDSGETPRHSAPSSRPTPVDWMGNDAQGNKPAGPVIARDAPPRPSPVVLPQGASETGIGIPDNSRAAGPAGPLNGDAAFPPEWVVVPAMIATFEPEDDEQLMNMWRADAAFQIACADAWRNQFDHLVNGLGLDPAAVQGVAEYADERGDSAHAANLMVQRFLTVYVEIKNYLANGGRLPHDGRFLTEEGAA